MTDQTSFIIAAGRADRFAPLLILTASVLTLLIILTDFMKVGFSPLLLKEGGGVENASFALLMLGAAAFCIGGAPSLLKRHWHVAVALLILAGRELDMDKKYFTSGLFKLRTYTGDAPLSEKLIGAAVILLVLWVLWRFARRDLASWIRNLRHGSRTAWVLFLGFGLAAFSKTIDGAARKLEPFGIEMSLETSAWLGGLEEVLELIFAFCVVYAVALWVQDHTRA
ncbi:hypothetical protein [Litoreibacter roseus]|uniref:Uncharacterized protein n=1 Tax=Litoreibacter roseus TaxID=2601869 RepID=A0A6N6JFX8_9RHOB|nr:hypothetical protein [Litoreibacter roseus]GFE65035.1 hypothetical protein KIN_21090 [Litoreibacter roseus]